VSRQFQQHGQGFSRIPIVIDDQNAACHRGSDLPRCRLYVRGRTRRICQGQPNDELTSPPRAGFDAATMHLDQSLNKAQSDADAPLRTVGGLVQLSEQVERARELI